MKKTFKEVYETAVKNIENYISDNGNQRMQQITNWLLNTTIPLHDIFDREHIQYVHTAEGFSDLLDNIDRLIDYDDICFITYEDFHRKHIKIKLCDKNDLEKITVKKIVYTDIPLSFKEVDILAEINFLESFDDFVKCIELEYSYRLFNNYVVESKTRCRPEVLNEYLSNPLYPKFNDKSFELSLSSITEIELFEFKKAKRDGQN